jgi:RNA recognition motif-containing protein
MASKLFVGNLPHSATDSELADFVTGAGFQIASAVVIHDKISGDSKGFGFVELADGANLQDAISKLDGQSLQGRRLNVNEARPQQPRSSGPRDGGYGSGGRGQGGGGFGRKRNY